MKIDDGLLEIDEEEVSIRTNIEQLEGVPDSIALVIEDKKKETFEISLNVNQANVIAEILNHYVTAFYEYRATATTQTVKAASA